MTVNLATTSSAPEMTNAALQDRKDNAVAVGMGNLFPVYVERASGSEIWDVEGKRYIDFAAGIAVCNTGHLHPKVTAAVKEQLDRFSHTCGMLTPYDSYVQLAERLNELAPGSTPKKSIFVTTGAEAVENCIKIARSHTGRRGVISFTGGFHGRTMMTMGLTGKVVPYKAGFGPFPADIYRAPYPMSYHGVSVEDALSALDMIFKTDLAPSDCAAMVIEPILGEGGFYPAPAEFLQALRERCDQHGIVLVIDEVQAGFARTGTFFCSEKSGIEPDLISVAKGIAGGFPLAGVIGKAHIMDAAAPGGLGGTYAASPLGCVAGLAVLDIIAEENLTERAQNISQRFKKHLTALQSRYPSTIGEIRCDNGAMIAVELVKNGNPGEPAADLIGPLLSEATKRGLLMISCGIYGNVIRFLPALTIPMDLVDEGLNIVEQCFDQVLS